MPLPKRPEQYLKSNNSCGSWNAPRYLLGWSIKGCGFTAKQFYSGKRLTSVFASFLNALAFITQQTALRHAEVICLYMIGIRRQQQSGIETCANCTDEPELMLNILNLKPERSQQGCSVAVWDRVKIQ